MFQFRRTDDPPLAWGALLALAAIAYVLGFAVAGAVFMLGRLAAPLVH